MDSVKSISGGSRAGTTELSVLSNCGFVILHVNNPAMIPFWYRVHRADRTIASGYNTKLNGTFLARGKDGYSMEITYLFGGKSKVIQEELPYVEKI
jgi:hypothetical protein